MQAQGEEEDLKGSVPNMVLGQHLGRPSSSAIKLPLYFKLQGNRDPGWLWPRRCWGGVSIHTTTQSTNSSPKRRSFLHISVSTNTNLLNSEWRHVVKMPHSWHSTRNKSFTGMCLQYTGFQMLLPRRVGFVTSVTAEEGEIWEANYLPSTENKPWASWPLPRWAPFRWAGDFYIEFLYLLIKFRSAEARVVFKTQWTPCQLMPNLNHSQIRLRAPAEPPFNFCEIHGAPNSFSWKPPVPR